MSLLRCRLSHNPAYNLPALNHAYKIVGVCSGIRFYHNRYVRVAVGNQKYVSLLSLLTTNYPEYETSDYSPCGNSNYDSMY